ncbi:FAD dependent oxidoreductase [Lipomyces chichibuensis]|uniref:FAD dependent oxidoreductase n=1 Tax=Lipomyces chichibuensis TaxID=1546026 RepID=UPI00334368F8
MPSKPVLTPSSSRVSTWLDPPTKFSMFRTTSELPATADLAIIGSGFSGASVAYHTLRAYPALSIVMLEASDVCEGASGRNGGHLRPDFYTYASQITAKYGPEEALLLSKFERDNFEAVKRLIKEDGVDCETVEDGESWQVFLTQEEFDEALRELTMMRDLGGDVHDIQVYMRDEAIAVTGIQGCFGAIVSPGSPISPTKLVSHLIEQSLVRGLNLQSHTKVLSVTLNNCSDATPYSSDNCAASHSELDEFENVDMNSLRIVPKNLSYLHKITTSRGTLLANKVVHATNAYVDMLLSISSNVRDTTKSPYDAVFVTPVRGHALEIAPVGMRRTLSLDPSHNITNMDFNRGGEYLIQRPNGNFVMGGGRRFGKGKGIESFNNKTTAETEIDGSVDHYLRFFFPQILCFDNSRYLSPPKTIFGESDTNEAHSADYRIVKQWTGIMGFSTDEYPLVGKIPSFLDQGQEYCIAGFAGHGMPRIFLAAKALVRMILLEDDEYKYDCQYHSTGAPMPGRYFEGIIEVAENVNMPQCFAITEERMTKMINLAKMKE